MAGYAVADNPRAWCKSGRDFRDAVVAADVSGWNADAVDAGLAEVRSVQRVLDGLVVRIGQRAKVLAAEDSSASAGEVLRGKGEIAGPQARREAVRAETAEGMPAVGAALSLSLIHI